MYRAFSEVNRHPLFKSSFKLSVFKENLLYESSSLKPSLSPSTLCKVLDSRWHRVHKFSYFGHQNFLPLVLDILKENFFVGCLCCSLSTSQMRGCARYVQLGSYLVTDSATRVFVCHFLDVKLVSFLLNDRGHHLS